VDYWRTNVQSQASKTVYLGQFFLNKKQNHYILCSRFFHEFYRSTDNENEIRIDRTELWSVRDGRRRNGFKPPFSLEPEVVCVRLIRFKRQLSPRKRYCSERHNYSEFALETILRTCAVRHVKNSRRKERFNEVFARILRLLRAHAWNRHWYCNVLSCVVIRSRGPFYLYTFYGGLFIGLRRGVRPAVDGISFYFCCYRFLLRFF